MAEEVTFDEQQLAELNTTLARAGLGPVEEGSVVDLNGNQFVVRTAG